MKFCEICSNEISTGDGDNRCNDCIDIDTAAKRKQANKNRKARESVMESLGLVKVRGALGGTYWE